MVTGKDVTDAIIILAQGVILAVVISWMVVGIYFYLRRKRKIKSFTKLLNGIVEDEEKP